MFYLIITMRKIGAYIIILTCFLFYQLKIYSQINVQNIGGENNKKNLILNNLIGEGVKIVGNITCNCDSLGYFSNAGDIFEMEEGIMLTTGYPKQFINASPRCELANDDRPDDDIRKIVGCIDNLSGSNPYCTRDACVIEFDAEFDSDGLVIEYVFASHEYTDFTCGKWNDAFGFFISGPGIEGKENIALIEGFNIPVSINTVNSGKCSYPFQCDGCNLDMKHLFKRDSRVGVDGFTTLLTAIKSLRKGVPYHIKIVVADVTDRCWDSGVLLKIKGL
jgi:hypothetical protein